MRLDGLTLMLVKVEMLLKLYNLDIEYSKERFSTDI